MAHLVQIAGPDPGAQVVLAVAKSIIGRHPDCQVVVDLGSVSRFHAQVLKVGDEFFIEDLGSRNGTFLNDRLIQGQHRLEDGDELRVCDVLFTFQNPPVAFGSVFGTVTSDGRATLDGSGYAPLLVDDGESRGSQTIMSTLDVSARGGSLRLKTSADVKLQALLEITRHLSRALSLDEVLPQVLESLFRIFLQADRGFVVLRNEKGLMVPRWTKLRNEGTDEQLRISRTIVQQVMETKEAVLSADAASDVRFDMSQSVADFRIRSMMCAPLLTADGEAIGVIQIDTLDQRHRFTEDDLDLLASVASQAAIAIDNAQLHEAALRQRAIARDLEVAREVQKGFLPERPPQVGDFQFYNYYQPANQVGGDYFDYVELPDGRLAVIVADVVGHGIAAALLMARLAAEMRFCLATEMRPSTAVARLNNLFCGGAFDDRFITLIMAVIDPRSCEITLVNAGHMVPLLKRATGAVEEPGNDLVGLPLGIMEGYDYEQLTLEVESGDLLTLYTDGVNEAMNDGGEMYGIGRIRQLVAAGEEGPQAVGRAIIDDMRRFCGPLAQGDDICLVCFGRDAAGNTDVQRKKLAAMG